MKADALDFLGDGSITFLALAALAWQLLWRPRAAFLQGVFLGLMGLPVLAATAYRVMVLHTPEAELMGVFGFAALAVNIAAARSLRQHREGDANIRAVWLFSRNDALANLAVIIAAGLVWLTATPWPDLVVAAVIAVLFLHSAWAILQDARRDGARAAAAPRTAL